jgi:hypothetical protein
MEQTMTQAKKGHLPRIEPVEMVHEVKIDLVKAGRLGLTLSQAATLSVVHQIIKNNLAEYVDIDDSRWWYITGRSISEFSPLVAAHAWTGAQNLIALARARLIELDEMSVAGAVWFVVKVNDRLVIDGAEL